MTSNQNPAEIYDRYFVPAIFVPWTQLMLDYARPQAGERVLDVACGTGIVARSVAPLVGLDGGVDALDSSAAMLAVARSLPASVGAAVEWHQGDALSLPFSEATFDLVLCQQGLQFFADRAAATREMRRVLKPTGRAVLSVWQALDRNPVYAALYHALVQQLSVDVNSFAAAYSLGSAEELRGLLEAAQFRQVEVAALTLIVRLPQPADFVKLTVSSVAAVIPVFAQMDSAARAALAEAVTHTMEAVLQPHIDGDVVAVPLSAHIGLACA